MSISLVFEESQVQLIVRAIGAAVSFDLARPLLASIDQQVRAEHERRLEMERVSPAPVVSNGKKPSGKRARTSA